MEEKKKKNKKKKGERGDTYMTSTVHVDKGSPKEDEDRGVA